MSTIIPGRRPLRSTRTTTAKDSENANARPRITSRAKPPSSSNILNPATAAGSKSKSGAALQKADPTAGKRKRDVENASSAANLRAAAGASKGKAKEDTTKLDGVVINKNRILGLRQPLRSLTAPRQKVSQQPGADGLQEIPEQPIEVADNAMLVDPPVAQILPSLTIRKSLLPADQVPHVVRRSEGTRSLSSRSLHHARQEEDPEASRVFKKRRTSSEAPEEAETIEQRMLEAEEAAISSLIVARLSEFVEEPEADPEADWDDLDAEDAEDPLMVSEYVVEVFEYYKQMEMLTLPNPDYMKTQADLGWSLRGILFDWLVQLHAAFGLLPETLFLAVNIIDRFLSNRVVSLAKLQLVGVTGMFIAAKVEEIIAPSVQDFAERADGTYTKEEILQAERYLLKTLDWNLSYPNPVNFLRRISKADDYNVQTRTLGKYFLEVSCLEWRLIAAPPSLIAAASMWLARLMLGKENWTPNLAHYSSYPESALIPTANIILNYILKPIRHEAFFRKYASRKYSKVSIFARSWAGSRWSEGEAVNLASELATLKKEIREMRVEAEVRMERQQDGASILGQTQPSIGTQRPRSRKA